MARPKKIKLAKADMPQGQMAIVPNSSFSVVSKNTTYNPDNISIATYDEMRQHPTIAGGLDIIKLPITSVDWFISGSDERKCKFIEKNLRQLWAGFIRDIVLAYDFGWSGFEKVFDYDSDGMIIMRKLISLSPYYTKIKRTPQLSYDGLTLESGAYQKADIPANKSFVFTYKKEYENYYGKPRIRGAYTPFYIHRYILEFTNKFYEKYASPTLVGYAPNIKSTYQGKEQYATDYLLNILKSIQNASAVVLPHTGGKKDELKYFVEALESKRTGGDFLAYLQYLDNSMFIGAGIPPLSVSSGSKGSYALFEEQSQLFAQGVDGDLTQIKQHIDNYIIKPLIEYNFGNSEKDDTQFTYQSLSNRDRELTRQVMLALVQQGKLDIAVKYLVNSLGLPAREAGEYLKETEKEIPEKKEEKEELKRCGCGIDLARKKFSRPPNKMEAHINFERINENYDKNESLVLASLAPILTKQKIKFIDGLQSAVESKDMNKIRNMDLYFRPEYGKKVSELSQSIFDDGNADVNSEMKTDIKVPTEAKAWVKTSAENIADKHQNDLKFAVISAVLAGMSKSLSNKEIIFDATTAWDDYVDTSMNDSSKLIVQKYYNEGRDWTGQESGAKWAEWSAVLDSKTCDYCAGRDGMVIDLNNPDADEYAPGNVHENCRCVWIYLTEEEVPEDAKSWSTPSKKDVNTYYMV